MISGTLGRNALEWSPDGCGYLLPGLALIRFHDISEQRHSPIHTVRCRSNRRKIFYLENGSLITAICQDSGGQRSHV